MAIFGRRRASSNPRPSTTSSSSAATLAASQAFLANKASNANLSNAAATAALLAHTPVPVPVGQIQTKRMQRRGSITSQTSAPDGRTSRPGGLQRRDSGGSMTERTFRSPSPGTSQDPRERPASSHGPYPRLDRDDAPPVPALPRNYASPPQKSNVSDRRPASLGPPHRSSPPPKPIGDLTLKSDKAAEITSPGVLKPKSKKTSDSIGDLERVESKSPVNFSRPMSPENALPKSPLASGRMRSPTPTTSPLGIPLVDEERHKNMTSPQDIAPTIVKKKKKRKAATKGSAEDIDLNKNLEDGQHSSTVSDLPPQEAALPIMPNPSPASIVGSESAIKAPSVKKKKKKLGQGDGSKVGADTFGASYPSDTDSVVSERSSTTDRPRYYNTRAAGLLAKQPSIVREDREGEEEAEEGAQGSEPNSLSISNGTANVEKLPRPPESGVKGRQHSRSASQQVTGQGPKLDVPGVVRHASLSPGRTAHFSTQPVNEGRKHQPPGRSVSPAKSALKSSPSRGHSPRVTRQGLAPSDASDSASQYSDDGSKSSIRKKSARVSFDEEPIIVGRAASPPSVPGSPKIISPQNRSTKARTWIDLVREQDQEIGDAEQENDGAIKPTPALPSFGSVRARENKSTEEAAKQPDHSDNNDQDFLPTIDPPTDQAIGSVIAADITTRHSEKSGSSPEKPKSNDPLPPEVTSVEGSGYHSENGDSSNDEDKITRAAHFRAPDVSEPLEQVSPSAPERSIGEQPGASVPQIAVQPATPGLETIMASRDSWLDMPGGFPSQKEEESEPNTTALPAVDPIRAPVIAKSEPEVIAETTHSPTTMDDEVAEMSMTRVEDIIEDESEDSTVGSIYSDAAEDQSDLEGDGFGSINAIVESPTSPDLGVVDGSPPASPLRAGRELHTQRGVVERKENELSEPESSEGWDRAQAYWSGLSQTRKQQLEQAALPGAIDEPIIRNRSMRGTDAVNKKKKKRTKKVQPQSLSSSNAVQTTSMAAPSPKSPIRSSSPQAALVPQLPLSLRDEPRKSALKSNDKRNSVNPQSPPRAALQKKSRPTSAAATVDYSKSTRSFSPSSAKSTSATTPASSGAPIPAQQQKHFPVAKPKIRNDNSDSDSSFKKIRPKSVDGQKYTMRRSMRSQSSETGSNRANSMAARTASPAETNVRRAFSQTGPNGSVGLRTSLRGSTDSSKPTRTSLRSPSESGKASRTKSPSRFSFLGSSKTKPAPAESTQASEFSSRFADSSDEDNAPALATSRFADSSDEEGSAGLRPVRGIPRRTNEGDSTDLDDSSEEKVPPPIKAQSNVNGGLKTQTPHSSSTEGAALASGSLRNPSGPQPPVPAMGTNLHAKKSAEKEKKKRSFFGSLSGRKHDVSSGAPKPELEGPPRSEPVPNGMKTNQVTQEPENSKAGGRVLGPSSLTADPVGMPKIDTNFQTGSETSITQNSPKSPKLQRRIIPKRITSSNDISWPLPQKSVDSAEVPARPKTSDGTPAPSSNTKSGPSLVLRQSVQAPVGSSGIGGVTLASSDTNMKKKKKFSMLRKAFGL